MLHAQPAQPPNPSTACSITPDPITCIMYAGYNRSCASMLPICPLGRQHRSFACCATSQPRHAYCHSHCQRQQLGCFPSSVTVLRWSITQCAAVVRLHRVRPAVWSRSVGAKSVSVSLSDPVLLGHVVVDIHLDGLLNHCLGLLSTQDLIHTHSLQGSGTATTRQAHSCVKLCTHISLDPGMLQTQAACANQPNQNKPAAGILSSMHAEQHTSRALSNHNHHQK